MLEGHQLRFDPRQRRTADSLERFIDGFRDKITCIYGLERHQLQCDSGSPRLSNQGTSNRLADKDFELSYGYYPRGSYKEDIDPRYKPGLPEVEDPRRVSRVAAGAGHQEGAGVQERYEDNTRTRRSNIRPS